MTASWSFGVLYMLHVQQNLMAAPRNSSFPFQVFIDQQLVYVGKIVEGARLNRIKKTLIPNLDYSCVLFLYTDKHTCVHVYLCKIYVKNLGQIRSWGE